MAAQWRNHAIASVRIVIETIICGIKRSRLVKDPLRLTKHGLSALVMEVACGLHNLRVTFRKPLPILALTAFAESTYFR